MGSLRSDLDGKPTRFPDLNLVLFELVTGANKALGAEFVGAYLTGSFAVGDADEFSDVDFLVVTHSDVDEQRVSGLQALHARLFGIDVEWAQHLEGSYAPAARLRRLEHPASEFLFLDNGASRLEWDAHCNTAVVRWVLREHNAVLSGPDVRTLVEPITAAELRDEAFSRVREYAEWASAPTKAGGMSRWKQPYVVLTLCRMLHTLTFGVVVSKRVAAEWAWAAFDVEWADLIQAAIDDRPDPWGRVHRAADPEDAERTLQFADYAVGEAGRRRRRGSLC